MWTSCPVAGLRRRRRRWRGATSRRSCRGWRQHGQSPEGRVGGATWTSKGCHAVSASCARLPGQRRARRSRAQQPAPLLAPRARPRALKPVLKRRCSAVCSRGGQRPTANRWPTDRNLQRSHASQGTNRPSLASRESRDAHDYTLQAKKSTAVRPVGAGPAEAWRGTRVSACCCRACLRDGCTARSPAAGRLLRKPRAPAHARTLRRRNGAIHQKMVPRRESGRRRASAWRGARGASERSSGLCTAPRQQMISELLAAVGPATLVDPTASRLRCVARDFVSSRTHLPKGMSPRDRR